MYSEISFFLDRMTTFGNGSAAAESSEQPGAAPDDAVDEEEDELNSLLRERRRWLDERRASNTDGQVQRLLTIVAQFWRKEKKISLRQFHNENTSPYFM